MKTFLFVAILLSVVHSANLCGSYVCLTGTVAKGNSTLTQCEGDVCTNVECCDCSSAVCPDRLCTVTNEGYSCQTPVPSCGIPTFGEGSFILGFGAANETSCEVVRGDPSFATIAGKVLFRYIRDCELTCLSCRTSDCPGTTTNPVGGICENLEPTPGSGFVCHGLVQDQKECPLANWYLGEGVEIIGWGPDANLRSCVEKSGNAMYRPYLYQSRDACESGCLDSSSFKISKLSAQTITWIVLAAGTGLIALFSYLYQNGYLAMFSTRRWDLDGPKPYQRSLVDKILETTKSKLEKGRSFHQKVDGGEFVEMHDKKDSKEGSEKEIVKKSSDKEGGDNEPLTTDSAETA